MFKYIFHLIVNSFKTTKLWTTPLSSYPIIIPILLISLSICSCNQEKTAISEPNEVDIVFNSNIENSFETLAKAFDTSDRLAWQKPSEVIHYLGDLSDKTVADIGAGTGYFSFRLAQEAKKVIAIDIDTMSLIFIDSSMQQLNPAIQSKIETRLAFPNNPMIKNDEVDVVLMVNTYSFVSKRIEYFKKLRKKLKPNAQLLVIDFKKKKLPIGPPSSLKVPLSTVEHELEQAGFKLVKSDDRLLDYQYLVHAVSN